MGRMTLPKLLQRVKAGHKLTMVTAYDVSSARLADAAGIDMVLVGDSLGNVVQGHDSTLPVTLDESLYHTRLVSRGCTAHSMVVGDMPFGTYHESDEQAVRNAVRYLKEAGAAAVKLEGGERVANRIRAIVEAQVPVVGHIGLTPQSVHMMGGYRVQRDEAELIRAASAVQAAGAFAVVLEGIPAPIARAVTEHLSIPTIGIGAGAGCSGQVLVWHDMLGLTTSPPRFVKIYADLATETDRALRAFIADVQAGTFPGDEHNYAP